MITVERIMEHNPCTGYPESRVRELIGDGKTPLEILDLPIPAVDRIWVLTRRGMIPEPQQHEFACRCVESVLQIYESHYPDDNRPRNAIETKRRWMRGEATDEELATAAAAAAALVAAGAAARAAAGVAARAAAWAAAGVAAWAAAWAAALDAAGAAELDAAEAAASVTASVAFDRQIGMLIEILSEEEP